MNEGYRLVEDAGRYKVAEDKFFKWKREGNVLTLQEFLQPASVCNYEKLFLNTQYQTHVLSVLPKLKKLGIDIIELIIFQQGLEPTKAFFQKVGLKFEVVSERRGGVFFCRLLL